MKKILLKYDVSNDLIMCPDRVADNFEDYIGGIYDWIRKDPAGEEYRQVLFDGEIGCIVSTDAILNYLNKVCIAENEEKAVLIKQRTSRWTKAFLKIEF